MLQRNVLLATPLLAILLALPARGQANDAPTRIAVANAAKIFRDSLYYKDLSDKIKASRNDFSDQVHKKQAELAQMQDHLNSLKPDSPQYTKDSHDLLQKSIEYDIYTKETELDLQRQQKMETKKLFGKVEQAIADVAQKEGITLVIADQRIDTPNDADLEKIEPNQLNTILFSRTVLYAAATVDITEKVKVAIDSQYNKENP